MKRILVVGAGLSGSVAANLISDNDNVLVDVIDRRNEIGGNCNDYRNSDGIMIHTYGSHIFHTDDRGVWNYLNRFASFHPYRHKVVASIHGAEVPLPFNLVSIRRSFPKEFADRLEQKLSETYGMGQKVPVLELLQQDDELRILAEYVYENVFLHYTEKQWGGSPESIDPSVTARVPISISESDLYFQDRFQGIPECGYTELVRRMLDKPNINVVLGVDAKEIDFEEYDLAIYSGSLDELMDYRMGVLPYRSVRFESDRLEQEYYQSHAVVNYPNDHEFTRIHEYKYYLGDVSPNTVIAREYSSDFVPGKNERFYPIRNESNCALYEKYRALAEKEYPNMHFLGRLGDYKYYDMDDAVRRVFDLCARLNLSGEFDV